LTSGGTPASAIFAGFDTSAAGSDTQAMTDDFLVDEFVVNGVSIIGDFTASAEGLASLVNSYTEQTGVKAGVATSADVSAGLAASVGNLYLVAEDGRNIQLATDGNADVDLAGIDLNGLADIDNTYAGSVTLRSNETIEIGGNNPASLGFTAGATEASTVSALQETSGTAASLTFELTATTTSVETSFVLNGTTITYTSGATNNLAGTTDSVNDLIDKINEQTQVTGVTASVVGDIAATSTIQLSTGLGTGITLVTTDVANTDTVNLLTSSDGTDVTGEDDIFGSADAGTFTVADINTSNTFTDLTNGDLTINGYTVDFSSAVTALASDTTNVIDKSTVDPNASAQLTAYSINNTEGLSDQVVATAYTEMNLGTVQAGEADAQFTLIVNGLVVDIDNPIENGDSNGNIAGTLNGAFAEAASLYDADPTTNASYGDAAGLLASVTADGELIITAEDGRNITVSVGGTANNDSLLSGFDVTAANSVTSKGTISLEAKEGFSVGEIGGDRSTLAGIESGGDSVADIDISTQQGANDAIAVIDRAIDSINSSRGDLGAASNRLDFTINNLSNVVENAAAARSRIQDADFAAESAALSRAQVLQQAGTAMLAQANAQPQQVLSLLQ